MFELLLQFRKREGHLNIYASHEEDGLKLGIWLSRQLMYQKKGELDHQRKIWMERAGIRWNVSYADKMIGLMHQYKCTNAAKAIVAYRDFILRME
mmetsp:Transcript_25724/g.38003  ORF Transcript_25724/g.38003 Transcript_25724/m.38003 type:complete len:95 (-) Transcript_25724:181-465(-)